MQRQSVRDMIAEVNGSAVVFDNPSFDNSIIGISTDGKVIYSYSKMIYELAEEDNISTEDAEDFISYNTIRMLPYIAEYQRPIIVQYENIEGGE